MINQFYKRSYKTKFKLVLTCIIATCIILANYSQVIAQNTDSILNSISTAPDQCFEWYQQDNKWYCKTEGNNIKKSWLLDKEKWYYLDEQGVMVKNTTLKINDRSYVFAENGVCTNKDDIGWKYFCGKWYYYDNNGLKLKNTTVDGFKLDEKGVRIEPESDYSPNAYYIQGPDGSLVDLQIIYNPKIESDGFYKRNDSWYLRKDNKNITGWVKHNYAWYYLDEQGAMVTAATLSIDGKEYVLGKNGVCTNKFN